MSDDLISPAKLFDWMETKFQRLDDRMHEGDRRLEKLENITSQTLIQATKTNGRMDRAEDWQRNHAAFHLEEDGEEEQALAFAAGQKSERDRAKSIAWRVWGEVRRYVYWGLAGGVALAIAGVARALWVAPW